MAPHYRSNHFLIPMGGDFMYANGHMNFLSMDRLIKYFNSKVQNVKLMYSTPSEYLSALKKANIVWPTKYDDMFPYADRMDDYWTGYFTSRANSKIFIRDGQASLHSSSKLYALRMINQTATDREIDEVIVANY